jgi:hypothetical protein
VSDLTTLWQNGFRVVVVKSGEEILSLKALSMSLGLNELNINLLYTPP